MMIGQNTVSIHVHIFTVYNKYMCMYKYCVCKVACKVDVHVHDLHVLIFTCTCMYVLICSETECFSCVNIHVYIWLLSGVN